MSDTDIPLEHRRLVCETCFWTGIKEIADVGMLRVMDFQRIGREIKRLESRTNEESVRGRLLVLHEQARELAEIITQLGVPLQWKLDDWYNTMDYITCPYCETTTTRASDAILSAEGAVVRKVRRLRDFAINMRLITE